MNLFSIMTDITRAHCEAAGYVKPAAVQVSSQNDTDETGGAVNPASSAGPERGSPLWERLRVKDTHDYRDYHQTDRSREHDTDVCGRPMRAGS